MMESNKKKTRHYIIGIQLAIQSQGIITANAMPFSTEYINVLVIASHFDDELIGCAGVLAEHIKRKHNCFVLYLTNGKGEKQQYNSDVRKQESLLGLKHLGDIKTFYFDIPDGELLNNIQYSQHLSEIIVSNNFERIYFPNPWDSYSDHACVGRFLSIALHTMKQVPELYAYEIMELLKFPNTYFEMSNYCLKKHKALQEHVSQHQYINYTKISSEINRMRGEQMNCGNTEMYQKVSLDELKNIY